MTTTTSPALAFWRRTFNGERGYLCVFSVDRGPKPGPVHEQFYAWPQTASNAEHWLQSEAAAGRDVYAGAALFTDRQRAKIRVGNVRAVWVDGDGATVPAHFPQPTLTVQTSPGRWNFYWLLTEAVDWKQAEDLNRRIAYAIGADKGGWDTTQLLRVPSFPNRKYESAPLVTVETDDGPVYTAAELKAAIPEAPADTKEATAATLTLGTDDGEPPVDLEGYALEVWQGLHMARDPRDGHPVRYRSLVNIARRVYDAGLNPKWIPIVLRERDHALGWHKFCCGRADADERYRTTAAVVVQKGRTPVAALPLTGRTGGDSELDRLRDELEELRAVNRGILAVLRSEAKPAAKIAAIELAIEAHTARPEDFTSLGGVADRISQSDDSVSDTCKAYRSVVPPAALRAEPAAGDPPFRVAYEARTANPWTGEITAVPGTNFPQPHIYTRITPTHARLSDTLAAIAATIPDELKKKSRADRGAKAEPTPIPDELIPSCPDDVDAEASQKPEMAQVARCDDCGSVLAAMTDDGTLLFPTTDISGSGKPNPHQTRRGLSYLYTDKSGRGEEVSQSRHEWVQACIERDRVRRQLGQARLRDGMA